MNIPAYHARILHDITNGIYEAYYAEIPALIVYAETEETVRANLPEILKDYIARAQKTGETLPEPWPCDPRQTFLRGGDALE